MNLDESEHYPPGPKIAYSYQNNPNRDPPNMRKISTNSQTYSVFLISFYFLSVFDYTIIHTGDGPHTMYDFHNSTDTLKF